MNNILQGIILLIIGVIMLYYRLKYPTRGPDIMGYDLNLTMAIIAILIIGIGIIIGWMPPISFF